MKLNETQVKKLLHSGIKLAEEKGMKLSFTILDDGGNMLAFYRMDGAKLVTIDISIKKAKTALHFETDTLTLVERFKDRVSGNLMDGYMLLPGGVPIIIDGVIFGSIAASGDTGENDHLIVSEAIKSMINMNEEKNDN